MPDQEQVAENASKPKPAKSAKKARKSKVGSKSARLKSSKAAKQPQVQVSADQLPQRSLEQALRVATAMRETLAGGPATWEDIASAMNITPRPQNKYFLWSAQAYNLVTRDESNKYSLSEIGRKFWRLRHQQKVLRPRFRR